MTQQQKVRELVEQLILDPTKLEQLDLNIETGLDIIECVLNEFPDPSEYADVFKQVELLLRAKHRYFNAREVC